MTTASLPVAMRARAALLALDIEEPTVEEIVEPVSFRQHLEQVAPGLNLDRWHTGKMIEYGQALVDREIENLAAAAPPRTGKSTILIQGLASYYLRRHPSGPKEKVKLACADKDLVDFQSRMIRDFVRSCGIPLRGDSTAVKQWQTVYGGVFKAETVGALKKGTGWSLGLMDDPFTSRSEALKSNVQTAAWKKWREDFLDRMESSFDGLAPIQMLMHQRLAKRDLWGRLVEWLIENPNEESWTFLVLKGYAESKSIVVPPGCFLVEDEREPGEPLCDDASVMVGIERRRRTDPELHRAEDQQDPADTSSGGLFCGSWFGPVRVLDPGEGLIRQFRGWDFSTGTGADSTASARGGHDRDLFDELARWRWLDVTEAKIQTAMLEGYVLDVARGDGRGVEQVLPIEPAMGKATTERIAALLRRADLPVHVYPQKESKRARSTPHANLAAAICPRCARLIVPEFSRPMFETHPLCECPETSGDETGRVEMARFELADRAKEVLHNFSGADGGDDDIADAMAVAVNVAKLLCQGGGWYYGGATT